MATASPAPKHVLVVNDAEEIVELFSDILKDQIGWQLAQKIRMSRDTQHIPIIICTAATEDVREQEGWLTANAIKVVLGAGRHQGSGAAGADGRRAHRRCRHRR